MNHLTVMIRDQSRLAEREGNSGSSAEGLPDNRCVVGAADPREVDSEQVCAGLQWRDAAGGHTSGLYANWSIPRTSGQGFERVCGSGR